MKKLTVILLALVLCLSLSLTAYATANTYLMTGVTDLEGNVLASMNEEGLMTDAAGNDFSDQFPVLVLVLDDEAMTCTFGTEEEAISGTFEIAEETEEGNVLNVTLEDGEAFQIIYTTGDVNACSYIDEENGMIYIMPEIDTAE